MWLFLGNSFLSIVAVKGAQNSDYLLVRSRQKFDIQRVFPEAKVTETLRSDYRFRSVILTNVVARTLADQCFGITYDNFKASIKDHRRHNVYMRVWALVAAEYAPMPSKARKGKAGSSLPALPPPTFPWSSSS